MRSTQRVTRHAGLRALRLLVGLLAAAAVASCSSGPSELTFTQYCADGRPTMVDVAAHRRGKTILVTWGLPHVVGEPRTYRVLRRGAGERWDRVGQLRLPVDAVRRYVDVAPPTGSLRYAVVEIDACGVGPICRPMNVGRRCAVATVPARGTG